MVLGENSSSCSGPKSFWSPSAGDSCLWQTRGRFPMLEASVLGCKLAPGSLQDLTCGCRQVRSFLPQTLHLGCRRDFTAEAASGLWEWLEVCLSCCSHQGPVLCRLVNRITLSWYLKPPGRFQTVRDADRFSAAPQNCPGTDLLILRVLAFSVSF